jgi:hypothetical protein
VQKKALVDNLKTTKKPIVASKPTEEAKLSGKVLPRMQSRLKAKFSVGR